MPAENVPLVYWYVAQSLQIHEVKATSLIGDLQSHGYTLHRENDLNVLCQHAEQLKQTQQPSLFILAGSPADSVSAIMRLRAINDETGIISMLPSHNEAAFTQALLCGADYYVTSDTGSSLLLAIINTVLRGQRQGVSQPLDSTCWLLQDGDWTISSPDGILVTLTTNERALFQQLIEATDGKVTHQHLLETIAVVDKSLAQTTRLNRLGVIISRLRRKFDDAGLDLPIKSVHNWGYMFVAPLERR